MSEVENQDGFDQWCVVEIMGHKTLAGRVTEQTIAGDKFLRIDVPECSGIPSFTQIFGTKAIHSMAPMEKETCLVAVRRLRAKPVDPFVLPIPEVPKQYQLPGGRFASVQAEEDQD